MNQLLAAFISEMTNGVEVVGVGLTRFIPAANKARSMKDRLAFLKAYHLWIIRDEGMSATDAWNRVATNMYEGDETMGLKHIRAWRRALERFAKEIAAQPVAAQQKAGKG